MTQDNQRVSCFSIITANANGKNLSKQQNVHEFLFGYAHGTLLGFKHLKKDYIQEGFLLK